MAKNKSKNSMLNILWGILTLAGLVLLIMPTFLAIFQQKLDGSDAGIDWGMTLGEYGLFGQISSLYQSTEIATVVSVLFVVGLALAAIYLILYVIDSFTKTKMDFSKIRMFLAFIMLALFIATLICGIVFVTQAVPEIASGVLPLTFGVGFWLGIVGMLVTSVFGFLAAKK